MRNIVSYLINRGCNILVDFQADQSRIWVRQRGVSHHVVRWKFRSSLRYCHNNSARHLRESQLIYRCQRFLDPGGVLHDNQLGQIGPLGDVLLNSVLHSSYFMHRYCLHSGNHKIGIEVVHRRGTVCDWVSRAASAGVSAVDVRRKLENKFFGGCEFGSALSCHAYVYTGELHVAEQNEQTLRGMQQSQLLLQYAKRRIQSWLHQCSNSIRHCRWSFLT